MGNTSTYNSVYYEQHRTEIAEQRRARRLAMSEQEREKERERQRQRSRKHATKRRAELDELVTLANRLADAMDAREYVQP